MSKGDFTDSHANPPSQAGLTLRKRAARVHCEDLTSNLGPVIDLSLSGARVVYRGLARWDVGTPVQLQLCGYGNRTAVSAQIARRRRLGFMTAELGIQFINLDAPTRQIISELVRCHSVRYAIVRDAA
ncbi:MAG: PilZ domain-containing protein [Phycisphaerales bacterium]|nr:PilZ domain-containing protein [Phycisphaerales bacterium]